MIEINGLQKSYLHKKKSINILKNISLNVDNGEMIAIMGKSGSGKSTLLNILSGLIQADRGEYKFDSQDMTSKTNGELAKFRRENIGFILQNNPLIDTKNVIDNVTLPLLHGNFSNKESIDKAKKILADLKLSHLEDKYPETLSGGEAQRVSIARALVNNPKLILADEPTGSLDEDTEKEILDLCTQINLQGNTMIIVTHNSYVAQRCNKVYKINDGECYPVDLDSK